MTRTIMPAWVRPNTLEWDARRMTALLREDEWWVKRQEQTGGLWGGTVNKTPTGEIAEGLERALEWGYSEYEVGWEMHGNLKFLALAENYAYYEWDAERKTLVLLNKVIGDNYLFKTLFAGKELTRTLATVTAIMEAQAQC